MDKKDLLQLLQETDLSPEAMEEIAAVLQKHKGTIRGTTHDAAMGQVETPNETIENFKATLVDQYNQFLRNGGDFPENGRVKHFAAVTAHIGPDGKVYLTPSLKFRGKYIVGDTSYYFNCNSSDPKHGDKLSEHELIRPASTIWDNLDAMKRTLPYYDFEKGQLR